MSQMPAILYAAAASRPKAIFKFRCIEDIPSGIQSQQKSTTSISVDEASYSTLATAQRSFNRGDPSLLPLSTSRKINEYRVITVDENHEVTFKHKLPYVERTNKLKIENKSNSETIRDLTQRLEDMEGTLNRYQEESQSLMRWQVAAQAVEAYTTLLWKEPSVFSKPTKEQLKKLHIHNPLQLRYQSQLHHDLNERDSTTRYANNIYNRIPINYRNLLDILLQHKNQAADARTMIAHPTIRQSQIKGFLISDSRFEQKNEATDLLNKIPSLEVLNMDGTIVSMFKED